MNEELTRIIRVAAILTLVILICCVPLVNAEDNNGTPLQENTTVISDNNRGCCIDTTVPQALPNITKVLAITPNVTTVLLIPNSTIVPQIISDNTSVYTILPTLKDTIKPSLTPIAKCVPTSPSRISPKEKGRYNYSTIISAIKEHERKLTTISFEIDDSLDATQKINQLIISESPVSPELKQNITAYTIPQGGIIKHSSDGRTRVFSPEGKQLFYIIDSNTKRISTTSGRTDPASHIIGVPSGSIIDSQGNNKYVVYDGKILLTCINEEFSSKYQSQINVPAYIAPSWVGWADSDTSLPIGYFSAFWTLPESPQLDPSTTHLLFNGITSDDPSCTNCKYIAQPVTGYNFEPNCFLSNDSQPQPGCEWANRWTGSSWLVFGPNNFDFHTYPPVQFLPGDQVWGYISMDSDIPNAYCIFTENERTSDYQKICLLGISQNAAYQQAVVAYEVWLSSQSVSDNNKMLSDVTFTSMGAYDNLGNPFTLEWHNHTGTLHPQMHGLFVDLSQKPSSVKIEMGHNLPPVARFIDDSCYNGNCPTQHDIKFTSTSYNNPTSWSWNFGDGGTGNGKDVMHSYQNSRLFTVTLTVSNSAGQTNSISQQYNMKGSSPPPTERVQNGALEGTASWTSGGSKGSGGSTSVVSQSAGGQSGGFVELDALGDPGGIGVKGWANAEVSQTVDLTNVDSLTFYLKGTGSHPAGSTEHLEVYLDSSIKYSNDYPAGMPSWQSNTIDVSSYTGNHVLKFFTSTTNGGNSIVGVDTVSAPAIPPVTSFSANTTSGTAPLDVQFYDTSTGNSSLWVWIFGDSSKSTEKYPIHQYSAGIYNVTLTATNTAGSTTITKTNYIVVTPPPAPIANFNANTTTGTAPLAVKFTDASTNSPTSWSWDFGDGNTSLLKDPTNTYVKNGRYNVSLTVYKTGAPSNTVTKTYNINVTPPPLLSNFTASPRAGPAAPLTVRFTDTSAGSPTGWNWNFGDGDTTNATKQHPVHTYSNPGAYTVNLTVSKNGFPDNRMTKMRYVSVGLLDQVGVFHPSNATFLLKNGTEIKTISIGYSNETPVTGDWNGDGHSDVGVFRNWSNTIKFILKNGSVTTVVPWGERTDIPVTGDWNGDGMWDVGVFRPSIATFILNNREITEIPWVQSTDIPVTGDWNGDGLTDVGVFRPNPTKFILNNGTEMTKIFVGQSTDIPVTGDWNGDGLTDVGVFRPSLKKFVLYNGTETTRIIFGESTDIPVTGRW